MWKRLLNRQSVGIAYRSIFSTPEGQLVLEDIMGVGKILEPCVTPEDEGMRRMALHILQNVNWKNVDVNKKLEEIVRHE